MRERATAAAEAGQWADSTSLSWRSRGQPRAFALGHMAHWISHTDQPTTAAMAARRLDDLPVQLYRCRRSCLQQLIDAYRARPYLID